MLRGWRIHLNKPFLSASPYIAFLKKVSWKKICFECDIWWMITWFLPLSHFSSAATQEAADIFGSIQLYICSPNSSPSKQGVCTLQHKHIIGVQICSRGLHLRGEIGTQWDTSLKGCNTVLHLKAHSSTWNTYETLMIQYHESLVDSEVQPMGPHDMDSRQLHNDCKMPFRQNLPKVFSLVVLCVTWSNSTVCVCKFCKLPHFITFLFHFSKFVY